MITLEEKHLAIIRNILKNYPHVFYAYGSRVKNTARPLSDLDLCIMDPISDQQLMQLMEDFDESDLPFKVDVRTWESMSNDFRNLIKDSLERIT